MSIAEYQKEMANLNKIAEEFQSECSCTKRSPGGSKLILPLKKTPKIESKVIEAPKSIEILTDKEYDYYAR